MPRPHRQTRNAEVDFRGEKRSNATHASTSDPDARLYKKSPGTGAMLCFIGHALMDEAGSAIGSKNPPQGSGLIEQGDLTRADGRAELRAAIDMIDRPSPGSTRRLTVGADKGFDTADFVAEMRRACVTPHVAQKARHSAIDGRTTRATKAMPYPSSTANGSKKLSAGPKPSEAPGLRPFRAEIFPLDRFPGALHPKPSTAASSACGPASSTPWPPTTWPDCRSSSRRDKAEKQKAAIPWR